ncbi:hypothetical protein B4064_3506 [Caldibacillus thermoamylovorans]|uniref:Uncharacterized protein n=1 Tax=Caldibacillus thermoamylovorans TaxID=35841 RepID=A0ABD4A831_9BACI|nr:hypothetical protein B4064_3506 [Caldibacillus thermoamylovorans]KIO64186.1 hypothetical protein B4166_2904 [Caldibacillus thermoamylovorans]KIO72805.1 hypothetical protein B4167_2747 [Caldibacillus thermoamylovorans]
MFVLPKGKSLRLIFFIFPKAMWKAKIDLLAFFNHNKVVLKM